jgi:hypothetical protein
MQERLEKNQKDSPADYADGTDIGKLLSAASAQSAGSVFENGRRLVFRSLLSTVAW